MPPSHPIRITIVLGTRPEAIKLAPVIQAMRADPAFACRVCVTAQHRQMLDPVLHLFDIQPDADLDLMRPDQTLAALTARAIEALDREFAENPADWVLVQGDTTTAFCGALAAFYRRIPVGHVEAGLRTGNLQTPWPEEANRQLVSRLTRHHFAPTAGGRNNLLREGIPETAITVTGNTVIDALFSILPKARKLPLHIPELYASGILDRGSATSAPQQPMPDFQRRQPLVDCGGSTPLSIAPARRRDSTTPTGIATPASPSTPRELQSSAFNLQPSQRLVLITAHRRENFGPGFEALCRAIAELAGRHPDVQFVYPVHLNPNVREPVRRILGRNHPNIHLIEPLDYLPFVALMDRAYLILTDSGGIQEEAPSLGKPVLVMRETTERPEAVDAGTVKLVGADRARIIAGVTALLTEPAQYQQMQRAHNPYGDGHATERILANLKLEIGN